MKELTSCPAVTRSGISVRSYYPERPVNRAREGRSMMKRFFIGMLILGGIIAAAAVFMKRRSGSDVSWDEFARDTSARMSDAAAGGTESAKDAADEAKEVMTDAAAEAKDNAKHASDEAQDLAEKATE
jgi:gas vesicle protein